MNKRLSLTEFLLALGKVSKKSALALLCTTVLFANVAFAENRAELTERQLKKVNQEISQLQKLLEEDKSSHKKETAALKSIEIKLANLYKKSRELKQEKKSIQEQISTLKKQENVLQEKNAQQTIALKKDLHAIYKLGKQEKLKLLLNQENPEDIARLLKYYDYYSEARLERILAYQENIELIAQKRSAIEEQLHELSLVEAKLKKEASLLEEGQTERQKVLAQLRQQIHSKDQQLSDLKENQGRLTKLLRSLKGIWADIPSKLSKSSISKRKGTLPYPVKGNVKHNFGSQRADGRLKWNGWLIEAAENQSVKAIHDGRVVFADWIRGYGLLIIIDHSDGFLSLYGHNASLLKEAGDWIQEGEPLATVGNSGGQYDIGLYFELRQDAQPLNPKHWLER